jgi:hypothetical protein
MSADLLPAYVDIASTETGLGLGLSFESYRFLARTALGIIEGLSVTMGTYKTPSGCVALDIFSCDKLLTIEINSKLGSLALFACDLDSAEEPQCILSVGDSRGLARTQTNGQGNYWNMKSTAPAPVVLRCNAIIRGKWHSAFTPLPFTLEKLPGCFERT